MAIKDQFYDQRPVVLFDPRGAQRLDPRFVFTRASSASFVDINGFIKVANPGEPRFTHSPVTRAITGVLRENESVNLIKQSVSLITSPWSNSASGTNVVPNSGLTPEGENSAWEIQRTESDAVTFTVVGQIIEGLVANTTYTFSVYAKGENFLASGSFGMALRLAETGPDIGANAVNLQINMNTYLVSSFFSAGSAFAQARQIVEDAGRGWVRISITFMATRNLSLNLGLWHGAYAGTVRTLPGNLFVWGPQLEPQDHATSYIYTETAAVTRAAELISLNNTFIPNEGSVYIDAATSSVSKGVYVSLGSDQNETIILRIQSTEDTYNIPSLLYTVGTATPAPLPLPVPLPGLQKNVITYGANNYHYQLGYARVNTGLQANVPSGLSSIAIGHNAEDPTEGLSGTLARFYLWPGEISPQVARSLVRGNFELLDSTEGPSINTGDYAFIVNTQGNNLDNSKLLQLRFNSHPEAFQIEWGDGQIQTINQSFSAQIITHEYPVAGVYMVKIIGSFVNIRFGGSLLSNRGDRLIRILQASTNWTPTELTDTYRGANKLDSNSLSGFPSTALISNFSHCWNGCSSLTTFPQLNLSSATDIRGAWQNCFNLQEFPVLVTSAVTFGSGAWLGCANLTSFPQLNLDSAVDMTFAWSGCSSLTTFPVINLPSCTTLNTSWQSCFNLTSFPLIDVSNVSNFSTTWSNCTSLTSFPLLDFSSALRIDSAWANCISLTSFPAIDTGNCLDMRSSWLGCTALTSFPVIDTSKVTEIHRAWRDCSNLTSFPALDFSSVVGAATPNSETTGFGRTWVNCTKLADFPPNLFDNVVTNHFFGAFASCALTSQSVENILVSINTSNTSNGILGLEGGTNAVKATWTANANTAYDALVARGWTITFRP
jgi:hypothetical protein